MLEVLKIRLNQICKKKKDLQRRYKNSPAFITKATKGIKKKIEKKNAWREVENNLSYEEGTY